MKKKILLKDNKKGIYDDLLILLREQLNLKMQNSNKQLKQTHLLKHVRRNIARIKTLLTKKGK